MRRGHDALKYLGRGSSECNLKPLEGGLWVVSVQICATDELRGSVSRGLCVEGKKEEESTHVDGSIHVPIPGFAMGAASAVGALQCAMVAM